MKFPLPRNLFPPVRLSHGQCAAYEQLTESVVTDALDEYHEFNHTRGRQLRRSEWKQIKKRDDIRVFCERRKGKADNRSTVSRATTAAEAELTATTMPEDDPDAISSLPMFRSTTYRADEYAAMRPTAASFAMSELSDFESEDEYRDTTVLSSPGSKPSAGSPPNSSKTATSKRAKPLPTLLAVGRVPGKVEDMVYGLSSPTPTHSMIKTAYVQDEVLDAMVLHEIEGATPDDPLRYLGLKWTVIKGHASLLGSSVRHRDFVFVESIGERTREDGAHFWYYVMHSVDVPGCRELSEMGIVRGRLSLCYLFRQDGATVDVFMKSTIAFNGSVSSKVALRTAANTLASVALAEVSSHSRKMGWEVTKRLRNPRRQALAADTPPPPSGARCSNCNKRFHLFSSALVCFFCTTRVCSKCCERRKLTIPNPAARKSFRVTKLVTRTAVKACKGCYTTVFRSQRPEDAAREEILAGEYGSMAPRAVAWQHHRPSDAVPEEEESEEQEEEEEEADDGAAGMYGWDRRSRAMSISSTSTMSVEDLKELVDQLARMSSVSADPEPLEEEIEWEENGREWSDSTVIELNRDDGEWVKSAPTSPTYSSYRESERHSTASMSSHNSNIAGEDLYARISKLHETAENLYQHVMSASVARGREP